MGTRLYTYKEIREWLEKAHSDWLRVLTPRHINAPARLLAPESAFRLIRERRDAELRQHP